MKTRTKVVYDKMTVDIVFRGEALRDLIFDRVSKEVLAVVKQYERNDWVFYKPSILKKSACLGVYDSYGRYAIELRRPLVTV